VKERIIQRYAAALAFFLVVLLRAAPAAAEWHLKPFVGVTFGGATTFVDLEQAVGEPKRVYGASGVLLGEVFGVEVDFMHAPGFFDTGDLASVQSSSVTTLFGSLMVALPHRLAEYTVRPYVVAGLGMMRVHIDDFLEVFAVTDRQLAMTFGGGATGFFSDRFGVSWDLRRFSRLPGRGEQGLDPDAEELSFWRANMAFVFRY
jgi:hypothetical protein